MNVIQIPLLIGFAVMAIGSLVLYVTGTKDPVYRHHTYLHSVVPFIAATSYLAMFLGTGLFTVQGELLFVPRYVDWSVTTPILLTGLVLTAAHEHRRHSGYVVSIVALDVIMIVTGLLSAISGTEAEKWIWYFWSCSAFVGVLYLLWSPLAHISRGNGEQLDSVYRKNLIFLTVVWLAYPIVFLIGPQGIKATDSLTNVWIIMVLDIVAKVVYGFYSASQFSNLPASSDVSR